MTPEEIRSHLRAARGIFEQSVQDVFGASLRDKVLDSAEETLGEMQETSDWAETEKKIIEGMLLELRLILP